MRQGVEDQPAGDAQGAIEYVAIVVVHVFGITFSGTERELPLWVVDVGNDERRIDGMRCR